MELKVDVNWKFGEVILYVRALKIQYEGILASFSYFEQPNKVEFIKNFRNSIYSFNFEEWKKDRLWDYINDFLPYEELISIARK